MTRIKDSTYRTIEIETKEGKTIVTYNEAMKETVSIDHDGKETTTFTPINVHELERLNALYEVSQDTKEVEIEGKEYEEEQTTYTIEMLRELNEIREQQSRDTIDVEMER